LQLPAQRDGPQLRSRGIQGGADRVALDRALLIEVGQVGWGKAVLMSQRKAEVGSRLTMSARGRGIPGRDWCVPHESVDITRLSGVMHEPAGVIVTKHFHCGEHSCV
jgi:hypothetical protein